MLLTDQVFPGQHVSRLSIIPDINGRQPIFVIAVTINSYKRAPVKHRFDKLVNGQRLKTSCRKNHCKKSKLKKSKVHSHLLSGLFFGKRFKQIFDLGRL